MNILIIYFLAFSILFFVIFLTVKTLIKIKNSSSRAKENKIILTNDTNSDNLVFKIKELKKLYEEGTINEKEFKIAKEKILKEK